MSKWALFESSILLYVPLKRSSLLLIVSLVNVKRFEKCCTDFNYE